MANRQFNEVQMNLVKGVVTLYAEVAVGAAGAVTLKKRQYKAAGATATTPASSLVNAPTSGIDYAVGNAQGIRSVSAAGDGLWTITLSDPYLYLLGVSLANTSNATGVPTVMGLGVVSGSTNVTTNTAKGNGGVVVLQLVGQDGGAVNPANGDTLTIKLELCLASVN